MEKQELKMNLYNGVRYKMVNSMLTVKLSYTNFLE